MPVAVSYPGVYIEEVPSGVRTITGVATSLTAFLGRTVKGPIDEPVQCNSFGDFERRFGGLAANRPLSYAVRDFFANGGGQALIVRLYALPDAPATPAAKLSVGGIGLAARSPGTWGRKLRMALDFDVSDEVRERLGLAADALLFNLTVRNGSSAERFVNVSIDENARRIDRVLAAESSLVGWGGAYPYVAPDPSAAVALRTADKTASDNLKTANNQLTSARGAIPQVPNDIATAQTAVDTAKTALASARTALSDPAAQADAALAAAITSGNLANVTAAKAQVLAAETALGGDDGKVLDGAAWIGSAADKTGLNALDKADLFNLLCIPPDDRGTSVPNPVWQAAAAYCERRRAVLVVDSPFEWSSIPVEAPGKAVAGLSAIGIGGTAARNAALYFPSIFASDPLRGGSIEEFVPCGAVAGIMARTDSQRGVWKAPAGLDAALNGIAGFKVNLTDAENGQLNPLGINCLRSFPVNGRVVWGARTLRGADQLADEWKYVPVRRTALFIEESLYRGTQWVVFEPNDEPLWSQIRLNVGAFMNGLFRQGAFQGKTPAEAYFVRCDKDTNPQNDIDRGIVNILVGFAPLKPAEFVIIKLQQIAGQLQV